jgi:hypothetical protein
MKPVVSGSLTSSPCNGCAVIAGGASLRPKGDDRARRSNANDGKHVALVERSDGAGQLWPIRPHPTHLFFLGRSLQTQKKVEGSAPTGSGLSRPRIASYCSALFGENLQTTWCGLIPIASCTYAAKRIELTRRCKVLTDNMQQSTDAVRNSPL